GAPGPTPRPPIPRRRHGLLPQKLPGAREPAERDLMLAPLERRNRPAQHDPWVLPRPPGGVAERGFRLFEPAQLLQREGERVQRGRSGAAFLRRGLERVHRLAPAALAERDQTQIEGRAA